MISVGSRDGRKGLGLGLGLGLGSAAAMEETELEEGEACSYQNDDDSNIDPDVALSYIDDKLQDVLGHFQKDFEGGVSAENLGAKFGGYGSFLPTHQRSPVWSRSRTPPKVHNYSTPRSPNNVHLEGGCHNNIVQSSTSLLVRQGHTSSTNAVPLPRASVNDLAKRDRGVSSAHCDEDSGSRCEVERNYSQPSDPKPLTVRIKVGSDNLSTRKNAEIYSGLGLDMSPTSSLEDSPTDSEGLSHEPHDVPDESPTSILQIMTSCPLQGDPLLSPLPDDLIYLIEKGRLPGESKDRLLHNGGQESSNRPDAAGSDDKTLGAKKLKSSEKNAYKLESKKLNDKDGQNGVGVLLKKEEDIDSFTCEEIVANTLKLPLLSNSYCSAVNSAKGTSSLVDGGKVANKVKEEPFSDLAKEEILEAVFSQDIGLADKPSGIVDSAGKLLEDKKANSYCDIFVPKKEDGSKGDKTDFSSNADSNVHKVRKVQNAGSVDSLERKACKKVKSHDEHDAQLASKKELSSSGEKGNLKEDNDADSEEIISVDKPKDIEAVDKSSFTSSSLKEKLNKKMDKPSKSGAYSKAAANAVPINGNGSISDVAPVLLGPLVKDNWVCCDKCQKWRLLPIGMNPDSLPENWLCSMLDWLPGMNKCIFSEEETTKALIAQYHIPAHEIQNNQHSHPGSILTGLPLDGASCFDHNHQNIGIPGVPGGGKKKNGIKDVSVSVSQDAPALSNSMKNIQAAVKSGSLNCMNQSPSANVVQTMHSSKSDVLEKHKEKQKEKTKLLDQHSDGGETRSSKKSKRDTDQDYSRISKKTKTVDRHCTQNGMPDPDGPLEKVGPSSSSGLSVNASEKDRHRHVDHSSKDRKSEANNSSRCPRRNANDHVHVVSDDRFADVKKYDDKDVKKRRIIENQDRHDVYTAFLPHGRDVLEQTNENARRKEKKARVSKSGGKEASVSRGSVGAAKEGRDAKDLGSALQSQAATSSSSKVSGSHKNKGNLQEAKGSPVESVSSSPLRVSNLDKSALVGMRSFEGKNDFGDAGLFATITPRRCLDGEDERENNRSGTLRKDETFVTHRESLESTLPDGKKRDMGHLAGDESKFSNCLYAEGDNDNMGNSTQFSSKSRTSDQCRIEERGNDNDYHANMSHPRKSGKGSSSQSKEKNASSKSEVDKGKVNVADSYKESVDHTSYEEKSRDGKNRVKEKVGGNSDKVEKNSVAKKEAAGKVVIENGKRESHSKLGEENGLDVKADALSSPDQKQNQQLDCDERSLKKCLLDKADQGERSGRQKSNPLPPSGKVQNEIGIQSLHSNLGTQKEKGGNVSILDSSDGDEASRAPKPIKKSENQSGNPPIKSRHTSINGHRVRDVDAPGFGIRDSTSQAATNAVKEATDLKHLADRLKNSGSSAESIGLYFQAALKFLHGASLFESSTAESTKQQGDVAHSMKIYSSTARLCEFCAHEFEKSKDMASAALAYKCMEVAYMRVIYSSHPKANRDGHELQRALQIVPPGESPSSSASDVDNLNNPSTLDKVTLAKGIASPQVTGNHVITARNRSSFDRLLNFTKDVNFAMEASRKSRLALSAANVRMEESQCRDGITSVKRALDFNFQDVEGLLHLVRLAMEAFGR
ncbi:hypothetical protein NMG60_11034941 [Bertholletia excelsa]